MKTIPKKELQEWIQEQRGKVKAREGFNVDDYDTGWYGGEESVLTRLYDIFIADTQPSLIVAKEFSKNVGCRFISEGNYSGELFRDTLLLPKLKQAIQDDKILLIDLDGTFGYGCGWLREVFCSLTDKLCILPKHILKHVKIKSNKEPGLIETITQYILYGEPDERN